MLNKYKTTFIFFISILIGQNTKPTVAILNFEGQGVDGSGKSVAMGMFFTVLSDGNKIIVQKMLLLK